MAKLLIICVTDPVLVNERYITDYRHMLPVITDTFVATVLIFLYLCRTCHLS